MTEKKTDALYNDAGFTAGLLLQAAAVMHQDAALMIR